MDVAGKVAVVTGANGSMGPAIVEALHERDCAVARWDFFAPDDETIACDVADADAVRRAYALTVERLGVPAVLITVAGISGGLSPIASEAAGDDWSRVLSGPQTWARVLNTNLIGVANCMRVFAEGLAQENSPGAIVTISSVSGWPVAEPGLAAYSASKAGLNQLTRCAANELGPLGIRVNAVAPGVMADPMLTPLRESATSAEARPDGFGESIKAHVPIERRHGRAADVAEAVCAVLQMDWATGQIIVADGGLTLRSPMST